MSGCIFPLIEPYRECGVLCVLSFSPLLNVTLGHFLETQRWTFQRVHQPGQYLKLALNLSLICNSGLILYQWDEHFLEDPVRFRPSVQVLQIDFDFRTPQLRGHFKRHVPAFSSQTIRVNFQVWKASSIYKDLLMSHRLVRSCGIPIWGKEGVPWDPNILLSRANSKKLPAHLVPVGWKVLSLSVPWKCIFLFCQKVLSVCVLWYVCKFCYRHVAMKEMGWVILLSLLPWTTSCQPPPLP